MSFLGAFAKLRKATLSCVTSVRLSVRPHGTTRLSLDGFLWNLIFEDFSEICRENSNVIKIGQEQRVLYIETYTYFWSYIAHFFLEWEIFQTNVVEKFKTRILYSVTFFETRDVYEIMWKNFVERGRPQMTIRSMRIACWITKATNTHT